MNDTNNLLVDDELDDIAPEILHATAFNPDVLPRFSSRRVSSNVSSSRGPSRYEHGPQLLHAQDLSSADALMADGVHAMNATLAAAVQDALGMPLPSMEVRFKDVYIAANVVQTSSGKPEVPTLLTPMRHALMQCCQKKRVVKKEILRGVSGVFKPGRITLVLGQPGSGKSALMKILSGRFPLSDSIEITGEILYNDVDRKTLLPCLPRFVGYVDQKDLHYPQLSVLETLVFAQRCCSGASLEPCIVQALSNCTAEQHDHALRVVTAHYKHAPAVVVKKLGLERCKNTIVGNAMTRGVSGGERKRVTTGEMAFGMKKVHLMDEISTGLDSAATFDIVNSLKSLAFHLKSTVVISLLQPPPEVFDLFDDVLIMNDGYVMFHGPRTAALPFFEDLGFQCPPRRDVADFLLDLGTDKQHAYVVSSNASGRKSNKSVPFLAADFAERFRSSDIFQDTLQELATPAAPNFSLPRTPFRQSFCEDLATVLRRQMQITLRNRAFLSGRAVMVTVMGLLYGSTFWQMDDTNAQLVVGLLFSCAMFLSMGQASQVPTFMDARAVFYKQRGSNFFRSSAYVLASSLTTIPFGIMETLLFGAVVYWMGGYVELADRFAVFLVTLFLCQMWFTSFFFLLSAAAPNLTIAQPMMMLAILIFMLFSGFLLAKTAMPEYLVWLYWLDPLAWCIRGLSVNQYTAPRFDVCVYKGIDYCARFNGQTMSAYSLSIFGFPSDFVWVIYSWIYFAVGYVVLVFAAYLALEYKRYESPENTTVVQTDLEADQDVYVAAPETPKMSDHALPASEFPHGAHRASGAGIASVDSGTSGSTTTAIPVDNYKRGIIPVALAFNDLWYSVPLPGGQHDDEIDLLQGVSGFALPGTMTALMGSSGAGKTTLMDVIAGRKTGGRIRGQILLNGFPSTDLAIRRCTGYCEQMDIHSESATVREALVFSAMLRQDARISTAEKLASVDECIELLELDAIADAIIRGSSTEQMKRITIGVELAAHPSILFMDEPTSGLDARSAKLIMTGVRKIADTGRTVVCTIHQPSTEVFQLFDALLLLQRGGRTVFFGELGTDASRLIAYFESVPNVKPIHAGSNPATWMLECIGAGVQATAAATTDNDTDANGTDKPAAVPLQFDFADYFATSDQKTLLDEDLDQDGVLRPSPHLPALSFGRKRASNASTQFYLLSLRFFRMYWRTPTYNLTRLLISVALGAIYGLIYNDTEFTTFNGANAGVGLVFISAMFIGLIGFNSVLPIAAAERTAFYRERASQTYNALWYFVASTIAEVPYVLLSALLFVAILFPAVGFAFTIKRFVLFWFVIALNVLLQVYTGQLFVYVLPSVEVASILGALLSSMYMLFAGFNPPAGDIPTGYLWLHYVSPPTYTVSVLTALVFAECSEDDSSLAGCQQLTGVPPQYGDSLTLKQYIETSFEMRFDNIGRDIAVLGALIVCFRLFALLALRYVNHQKR